jgi:3-dehydroquinate synthase
MLEVNLGTRSYPIVVEAGLLARAGEQIARAGRFSSAVLLSHPHLAARYAPPLLSELDRIGVPARLVTVPSGERHKNLATVARLYDALLDAGLDRRSALITLGGGVLGDVGGFVAATYLRGIPFLQVPTTLLAQVDASVGGKTGVDLPRGKNLVGAFYQPRAVLIDTDTLRTLPARELRSGLAEVVKYGIISDKAFFARAQAQMPRLLRRDPEALAAAIVRSCEIKADVVRQDETEQGLRAILNFGHTVGHALEAVTGYRRYKHGEAVAIGMVSAALIGEEIGVTPREVREAIVAVLTAANLPTAFPADVPTEPILEAMGRDKKKVAGQLRFVLAARLGSVIVTGDVPPSAVRAALERQRQGI